MRLGRIKPVFAACVLAGAMLPAVSARAALNAYMQIDGAKQGKLEGESERIGITGISHNVTMTGDQAVGRRMHGEITITKEIDAASPKLFQAMNTHEGLTDVMIVFENPGAGAKTARTIELKDAMITSVRTAGRSEQITISYQTIQVTYTSGNKSATDDWDAR